MSSTYDATAGSCQTSTECQSSSGCPCGTPGCSGEPIDCAVGMWSCAFFAAMKGVQADLLKAKIQKAWGARMDKAADAVIDAMGAQWQSMLVQAQAKTELRQRLQAIWQEGRK